MQGNPHHREAAACGFHYLGWKPVGRLPPLPTHSSLWAHSAESVSHGTSLPRLNFDSKGGATLETFSVRNDRFDDNADNEAVSIPKWGRRNGATRCHCLR